MRYKDDTQAPLRLNSLTSMSTDAEQAPQWQPRQRIRPRRYQSTPALHERYSGHQITLRGGNAKTLGPLKEEIGLVNGSTRSLKILFTPHPPHHNCHNQSPTPTGAAVTGGEQSAQPTLGLPSAVAAPSAVVAESSQSVIAFAAKGASALQPALLGSLFSHHGIAIRHEYLLEMSRKSKRKGRVGPGVGIDIMDSLVSSIDEIEAKSPLSNGHRRQRSDEYESVIMVSPAPVIQTSKSSTRGPATTNKLSKRSSPRNSVRDSMGRISLRSSTSQEHWLPPLEQDEDIFSIPTGRRSYSSSPSNQPIQHLSIPARTTSIMHDLPSPQIPQRANSLIHTSHSPPITNRPSARRAETASDIPSYIHRYLRERTDSQENLSVDIPKSPRRSTHSARNLPRSRNSTTAIPGSDHIQRLKLVTKRQSSQGFERDMSATRHFYSLPTPSQSNVRRSASLKPSRSSMASSGSNSFGGVNSNYVDEVLSNPKLTQRIRLTTGRILSFSEVGDENGWPVFCFTGMGLNRLVAAFYDEVAASFGLRIITPDRPGIGLSDEIRPSPKKVLAWADDITEVCQALSIKHFSLIGHSLGATYALAVALRLPERIRGRVHLLAPWIPLSQVNAATAMFDDIAMDSSCMSFPATHRFLRVLPVPIIKVAGSFLREKEYDGKSNGMSGPRETRRSTSIPPSRGRGVNGSTKNGDYREDNLTPESPISSIPENDLVAAIWAAATRDSNATVDLLTSLERPYNVGFTYFDVTLPVVIRHGSKDERVPLERVMWMTKAMNMARANNAELKVIQGAQHGLMARADVMSDVFEEIARESHQWNGCIRCRKGGGCWLASTVKDGPPVPVKEKDRSRR